MIYAVNFGGIQQPERRTPAVIRPRRSAGHVAAAGRAGSLGAVRGGHQPAEPSERGAIEPELEYDPTSDRPRVVEQRDQSIPRLPTIGLRFNF